MKKLLLAAILACGAVVPMSAEFSVLYQGQPVENGSTIVFEEYTVDVQEYGDYGTFYSWKVDPELYLVTDQPGLMTVHALSLNGEQIQLCAGSTCIQGVDLTKDKINFVVENEENENFPLVDVPLNLQLDWAKQTTNEPEIYIPALDIDVEVFYNDEPEKVLRFNLKMGGYEAAGVESLSLNEAAVRVNGKTLYYDVNGPSQLSLYSLSGKTVLNTGVSGNGSISLDNLQKGVYVYRLAGKTTKTAKIIIK